MGRSGTGRSDERDALPDPVLVYLYSSLIFLLRRTDQRAVSLFNHHARSLGMTLPQSHVLYIANEVGAFAQGEIARQVAADEATTSIVVTTLVKRGWLERIADPADGRRKLVHVTAAGRTQFEAVRPAFLKALDELERPTADRQGRLVHLLAKLVDRGGGAVAGPSDLAPVASRKLTIVHRSLQFLVRRGIQLIEQRSGPVISAEGVTLRQFVVLLIVALRSGIGESGIASTIGLDLSNTSFILRGLVAKNLVRADLDGRRRRYTSTAEGQRLLWSVEPSIAGASSGLLDMLSEDERAELLRLLAAVVIGEGEGGPPALARIVRRPDWPAAQHPAAFRNLIDGRGEAAIEEVPLVDLLILAARRAESDASLVPSLSDEEQRQLRAALKPFAARRPSDASDQENEQPMEQPGRLRKARGSKEP